MDNWTENKFLDQQTYVEYFKVKMARNMLNYRGSQN